MTLNLPPRRAVDRRRLEQVLGDPLESSKEENDRQSDVLPREDKHQRPHDEFGFGQPPDGLLGRIKDTDLDEQGVQDSPLV